MIAFIENALV